jgi:hypothetical protein
MSQETINKWKDWAAIILPIVGFAILFYSTATKDIEINALKIKNLEERMDNYQKDNQKIYDIVNELKLDMNRNFNEIKLELKDKQDKSANR